MFSSYENRNLILQFYIFSIDRFNRPIPTAIIKLDTILCEGEEESECSSTESIPSVGDVASVCLRLRPTEATQETTNYEITNNIFKIWNSANRTDRDVMQKNYTFSSIFGDEVRQREVYSTCVETAIENDDNLTILTYGTSGSGKTFTLIGEADKPGIIPRAIEHIFARHEGSICQIPTLKSCKGSYTILHDDAIEDEQSKRMLYFNESNRSMFSGAKEKIKSEHHFVRLAPTNTKVYIWISFVEIYNENVYDLLELQPPNTQKKRNCLKILSNKGNSFIKDLTSVFATSSDEASQLLTMGMNSRLNASTNINNNSSRSHCLFLIDALIENSSRVSHISYKFCDLAGSERLKKTETSGCRLKETQNINTSLMVLGRCLDTVYTNQQKTKNDLVPFRESKLTLFLQSALLGKEKLTMVVNVSPTFEFYEENLNVLKYASMAQEIVFKKPNKENVSRRARYSHFLKQACSSTMYNNSEDCGYSDISLVLDENYRYNYKCPNGQHVHNSTSLYISD